MATIPKRMSELLEEQKYASGLASDLNDFALGSDAVAAAQGGLDPVSDVEAGSADVAAGAVDVGEAAAPEVESLASKAWSGIKGLFGDGGASTTADTATTTADTASTDTAATDTSTQAADSADPAATDTTDSSSSPSRWSNLKGMVGKGLKLQGVESTVNKLTGNTSQTGVGGSPQPLGPYGGASGGGGAVRVGPMLSSKQAGSAMEMEILNQVKDVPRLLEMILETLCRCGLPTAGKFNGMPHCVPGSGCADNVALSATNPTGDNCCSCGNPNCSGSFHGQPICAPGQGCNDHWDSEKGARRWNPIMESPAEKIADHDNWASKTNHGEFEMPEESKTTWE